MPRGSTTRLLEWAYSRLEGEERRRHPREKRVHQFEKLIRRLLAISYAEERRSPRRNLLKVDVGKATSGIWPIIKVRGLCVEVAEVGVVRVPRASSTVR